MPIRLTSASKIGFFIDHLQELELVINLMEGGIDEKNFLIHQNGDDLDKLLGCL